MPAATENGGATARQPSAGAAKHAVVLVLDYGSQYTQLIARRIREKGVYSMLLPGDVSLVRGGGMWRGARERGKIWRAFFASARARFGCSPAGLGHRALCAP